MSLATGLFEAGERQTVLTFFGQCHAFWKMDRGELKQWADQANSNRLPDFGANLVACATAPITIGRASVIPSDFSSDENLIHSTPPRTQPPISGLKSWPCGEVPARMDRPGQVSEIGVSSTA
jgi:hypothetical protein